MNLLRQCTFVDRFRNSYIELDDLIEENLNSRNNNVSASTNSSADNHQSSNEHADTKNKTNYYELHLFLYFTANWLAETNACSKNLNKKLASMKTKLNNNKKQSTKANNNFELIFISADKTKDSYKQFLNSNTFIRYSLSFQDEEIKKQLWNYFNINGIPFLTVLTLKLDYNLKIMDYHSDKTNIKIQFLNDDSYDGFPWKSKIINRSTTSLKINNSNEQEPDSKLTEIKIEVEKKPVNGNNTSSREVSTIDIKFECKSSNKLTSETDIIEKNLNATSLTNGVNELSDNNDTVNNNTEDKTILLDLCDKLIPINSNLRECNKEMINKLLCENKFLFILFGSKKVENNKIIINGWIKFWTEYHLKHKFFIVYFDFDKKDELVNADIKNVTWFTVKDKNFKYKLSDYYNVKSIPKLIMLDIQTGIILNNDFKLNLSKCSSQIFSENEEQSNKSNISTQGHIKSYDSNRIFLNEKDLTKKLNICFDSLNFNFDFDNYEIYDQIRKSSKAGKSSSSTSSSTKSKKTNKDSSILNIKKILDDDLLKHLNENLIDISTMLKYKSLAMIDDENDDENNINNVNRSSNLVETFYLLYFCSNFTTSNTSFLDNVITYLKLMQEKIKCRIKVVIISSDKLEADYNELIKRHRIDFNEENDQFIRLALDFNSKDIKERLFCLLGVNGIPWFSLVNAANGEVLCENLKIFILNSQLRSIVF